MCELLCVARWAMADDREGSLEAQQGTAAAAAGVVVVVTRAAVVGGASALKAAKAGQGDRGEGLLLLLMRAQTCRHNRGF